MEMHWTLITGGYVLLSTVKRNYSLTQIWGLIYTSSLWNISWIIFLSLYCLFLNVLFLISCFIVLHMLDFPTQQEWDFICKDKRVQHSQDQPHKLRTQCSCILLSICFLISSMVSDTEKIFDHDFLSEFKLSYLILSELVIFLNPCVILKPLLSLLVASSIHHLSKELFTLEKDFLPVRMSKISHRPHGFTH